MACDDEIKCAVHYTKQASKSHIIRAQDMRVRGKKSAVYTECVQVCIYL